jgi:ABC-type multidrug transport system fused ATPase/permease subunit
MRLTLHRIVLFLLIKISPKLFRRYYAEYHYTHEKYLRHKKVESVNSHLKELMKNPKFKRAYKKEKKNFEKQWRKKIKKLDKNNVKIHLT